MKLIISVIGTSKGYILVQKKRLNLMNKLIERESVKKQVHVVHHTHWDLEWYFSEHEASIQFSYHMDEVLFALENNIINNYTLDGQMSILDNYMDNNSDKRERIKKLVMDKKLNIGPWYTQTDELIVRGEAILRNIRLGIHLASQLGGYMNIGYLPDSFGQSKDMPKIYNGLGIYNAIFWRGNSKDKTKYREFVWRSEDGSKVKVANIKNGYFVGVGLIENDNPEELVEIIDEGATGKDLLLPVGGDQRYVDFNLRDRIRFYNKHLDNYYLKESCYDNFFKNISNNCLEEISGELISSSVSKIHRSIYSSRYDHKYMNDKIERRMIYQVEPLMSIADELGIEYKQNLLDKIWKLLSKNNAHDGSGGCNSDKTNRIINNRYVEADQLSYSIIDYLTRKISESYVDIHNNQLMIYNTLPWNREQNTKLKISTKYKYFKIVDKLGNMVPFDLLNTRKEFNGSIQKNITNEYNKSFYYIHELVLNVCIPSLSFSVYQVLEDQNQRLVENSSQNEISNKFYTVFIRDGKINLLDKNTNIVTENVLFFEDSGDDGDTYDYSPPLKDNNYQLNFNNSSINYFCGQIYQSMTIKGTWEIPYDLLDRETNTVNTTICYKLKVNLQKDNHNIDFHLDIVNKAIEHRLRAVINSKFSNKYSYSNTPFGTIRRPTEDPHLKDWKILGWKEEPTAIYPMISWVNCHNNNNSYSIFSKGIKEYELIGDNYNKIALTLFRSVSFLGKPDLLRRPGKASGNEFKYIPTPDSQLKQRLSFKFSLNINKKYVPSYIEKNYINETISLPYYQIQNLNSFTTSIRYFVSNSLSNKIDIPINLQLDSPDLVFSSLSKNISYNGWDIRVYNPKLDSVADGGNILLPRESYYQLVDLKGIPMGNRYYGNNIKLDSFKPGEIRTINIKI